MQNNETRGWLYNNMKSLGYDLGSYEEFDAHADEEETRKWLYDNGSRSGLNLGSYEEFDVGLGKKSNNSEGSVARQVAAESGNNYNPEAGKGSDPTLNNTRRISPPSSPYVTGKGADVRVFDVPYNDYIAMSPQQQSEVYQKAIDKKKVEENELISQSLSSQKESVNADLRNVYNEIRADEEQYRKEHPLLSFLQGFGQAQTGGRNQRTVEADPRYRNLQAASNLIDESENLLNEAKANKDSAIRNFGRGFRDMVFDVDTWTAGFSDLNNSLSLSTVLDKAEKGEELSPDEQRLLDASVINLAVNAFTSSDISAGYNVGKTSAYSIPFMLEFAVNPISRSGNTIARNLLEYGLKRFGRSSAQTAKKGALNALGRGITSDAGKFAGRFIGDTVAAAGMTATTSLPRVMSGAVERMNDNYTYDVDENGELAVKRDGNVGIGEAVGKSAASTLLENQSEMVFNAFKGMGKSLFGGINKSLPGGVQEFFNRISSSKPGQLYRELKNNPTMREIAQRTQFHGLPEEYLEEVYNNFANIPLGEMSWEEATDLDNNIQTFLSLAPTSVMFGMLGLGSMASERYSNRRKLNRAFGRMNEEQKAGLKELLRKSKENGNAEIREFIKATIADESMTPEQKREQIEHAFEIAKGNAIDDIQEAETEDSIEKETEEISSLSDPSTGTYTEANRIVVNDVGEEVFVPGYIVGNIGGRPVWVAEGMENVPENRITLKPGELDESSVRSMPTQEVMSSVADMRRAQAKEQAENESKYSPDIKPPFINEMFSDGTNTYQIVRQEPDGSWLANVLNESGTPIRTIPMTDDEYYRIRQSQIDAEEQRTEGAVSGNKLLSDGRMAVQTGTDGNEVAYDVTDRNGNVVDSGSMQAAEFSSLQDYIPESNNMSEKGADNETRPEDGESKVSENPTEEAYAIPSDEKGNLLYHKVPVNVTVEALNKEELEPEEVDSFVKANKDASAKLLSGLQNKPPKMGTNIAKYKADKQAWQEKVADAQSQVDYWNLIDESIAASRVQPGDKTAKEIREMGEPLDGHELAARSLANGRLPLLYDDYKRELGFSDKEASKMFGLFKNRDNGGLTIEQAGELLMQNDLEEGTNFFDQNDANAGRNAILDVLSSARTRNDLSGYIKKNREAMAERERTAEREYEDKQREDWAQENFGMSYSDYVTFNEVIDDIIREKAIPEEEIGEFYNTFAEELNNWNNGRVKEETEGNDRGTDSEGGESGEGVLPDEQLGDTGGVEADTPAETDVNADNEGVPAPEENIEARIEEARKEVAPNPTDAQKEAGNYKKGHVKIDGYDITIENPKGSERSGIDANGDKWSVTMNNDYGYIRGTEGVDGDHIDVFLSDNPAEGNVYVVDQLDTTTGKFDEHKVMYGFGSIQEATDAYLANYSPGWMGIGAVTEVSKDEFKKWIDSSHRKTKPFVEYKSVNAGTNTRFREAEDRKELIAVHNISEEKLKEALDLGGFPMPSIAITKADVGHTTFGDISLVFDKESINPTDRRNKVYGEDAWTPVFPSIGYKLNGDKTNDIYRRANKVGHLPLFNPISFHPDNYERHINGLGSKSLVNHFRDNYDAKQLYLSENGNAVEEYERHEADKFLPGEVALYEKTLKEIGIERLKNDSYDTLENDVKRLIREHYNVDFDTMKPFMVKARISNTIRRAVDYAENGNKKAENDIEATKKKIDERIAPEKFEEWLEELFADVVEKRGIRNDRDMFTPSGNRRKWEQLYDEITLDNVVNTMQKQVAKGGQGLFGASIFGAAQEEYKSIDEIRKAARERIRTMDEADYNAQRDAITDRLSAIKIPGVGNSFSDTMDMVQNIQDAVARSHTAKGIHKYLKEFYPKVTMEAANEIADIVKDIQRMSARYFEAKPYRAVGFDEVRLAVVPSNTDANLVEQLKRHGIEVRTYKRGNEGQREQVVKEATDEMNLIFREIEGVNRKFNEELSGLNEENANSVRLELGHPSNVLLSAGIPDKPLMLYGNKLLKKVQKHNFEIKDVRNLPMSLEHPIAVFDGSHSNSYAVLTEMQINGKNVLVSIETNKQGEVDFNIISSVFGKNDKGVIKWVIDGKLKYVDKGKTLPYISASAPIADATYKKELSDATKIVENFENPTVEQGKITRTIEDLSSSLHTPVKIARTLDDVSDTAAKRAIEQGRSVKAWFDPNTGEVVVYLPNATDVNDAVKSVLHEVVGHKGLREMLVSKEVKGAEERRMAFDNAMMELYRQLPIEVRNEIADIAVRSYGGDVSIAMDEYLAEQAEKNEIPSWWNKVVATIRDLLRKFGIDVKLSENDVRYLLWESQRKLRNSGNPIDVARETVMRDKLGIGEHSKRAYHGGESDFTNPSLSRFSSPARKEGESVLDYADRVDKAYREFLENQEALRLREVDKEDRDVPLTSPTVQAWDKLANSTKFLLRETAVDYLTAVEKFQDLISKTSGKEIKSYEDAYQSMLALSSKNKDEMDRFDSFFVKPMNRAILKLTGKKKGLKKWNWDQGPLRELVMYVEAKHGIERNRQMAVENFASEDKEKMNSLLDMWNLEKERINKQEISWKEKQFQLDEAAALIGADLKKDYSGLSSIFKDKEAYPEGWKEASENFVNQYEETHEKKDIDELWKTISNATGYALNKQYQSGLVSKEYVERQLGRFENYIPLRGFKDEIAGDVYNYIENEYYKAGNPVKSAGGRSSEAGNPFGSILNIAYSSISSGNKNIAKQDLFNLILNHGTDGLAVIDRSWRVTYDALKDYSGLIVIPENKTGENVEWVEAVPYIPEGASPEEVAGILNRFEEAMESLKKDGKAETINKKGSTAYKTLYKERNEHQIPLFVGGDKYVITITGNPRLAQAMNGLLNPEINEGALSEIGNKVQRFMAGAFTSNNIAFAVANLSKDTIYSNNQMFIRESPGYWWKFTKNQKAGFLEYPQMMVRLKKYQNGTLDVKNDTDQLFKEFMEHGGATGYTFVDTQKEYAKKLADDLNGLAKKMPQKLSAKGLFHTVFDSIEFAGQSAELVNRFAAYKTSREMGRSVKRSITDAKEVTVNFNRKGAGIKTAKGGNVPAGIALMAGFSQYGRASILFWNANMQAKYRFYKNLKEHPVKTGTTLIANSIALGAVTIPFLNNIVLPALYSVFGWDDDSDKEDYYDVLTDYERTNNICIRLPKGKGWLKIPLSPELAPWYSMGDLIGGKVNGKLDVTTADFSKNFVDAVSPLGINWEYEGPKSLLNFMPTITQPLIQNAMNVNFMGNPIAKEPISEKQKYNPKFKQVYRNTSPLLIELSKTINSIGGGDDVKASGAFTDWNPAYVQNLINGYTGGYGSVILSLADWIVDSSKNESASTTASRMPLVSRFFVSGNEEVKQRRINSSFHKVGDFVNEFEHDLKEYTKAIKESEKDKDLLRKAEYVEKLEKLINSPDSKKYQILKEVNKSVKEYDKYLKEFPDDEETQAIVYRIKMEGIEMLRK